MTTRTKRGRVVAVTPPAGKAHGRLLAGVPAAHARPNHGSASRRLAVAMLDRQLALMLGDRPAYRTARRRADRARRAVLAEVGGVDEVRRVGEALAAARPALRLAARAHVEARPFAVMAAAQLVALTREHEVTCSAALGLLGSSATMHAIAEMLRGRVFASSPAEVDGDLVRLAATAAAAARTDLLTALQVEREARAARPPPDLAAVWARMQREAGPRTTDDDGGTDDER